MSVLGMKFYFIMDKRIIKVGLDTKKRFPYLAGKKVPWITVTFNKIENRIIEIRIAPAYINSDGYWTLEVESRHVATVINKIFQGIGIFKEENKGNIVSFEYKPTLIKLTDFQKELVKKRIDHDFGKGTWDRLPPSFKVNLWSKGITNPAR